MVSDNDVSHDRLVLMRVEGLHCHRCESAIRAAISANPAVREVEVDYPSGQVSVLFHADRITPQELVDSVTQAGYRVVDLAQAGGAHSHPDHGAPASDPTRN